MQTCMVHLVHLVHLIVRMWHLTTLRVLAKRPLFSLFVVKQEGDKMTESQFVNNNRGIDQGRDIPKEELQAMYRRVKVCNAFRITGGIKFGLWRICQL